MRQKLIFFYRSLLSVLIILALVERLGFFKGNLDLTTFVYYTNLSNLLVACVSGYTAYKMWQSIKKKKEYQMSQSLSKLRIATTVLILVTGLVYHFVLYPQYKLENSTYNWFTFYNIISHYVSPLAMFLDWIFMDSKIKLKIWDPLKWLVFPVVYVIYAIVYGLIGPIIPNAGSTYVYFFLNIDKNGILNVSVWVAILLLIFCILNYLIYILNSFLLKT